MALTINTNVAALNAQRNLGTTQGTLNTSLQRLSSGLRINSAKDDAAGLAISQRMTSQIRGLNQAARNANDAISLAQTAEGALQESGNILQRMRELAIQSANDTNSSSDRANLQKEVAQLKSELNRIAEQTSFNGQKILDGTFNAAKFHVGAFADESISVSVGNASATAMGAHSVNGAANIGITETVAGAVAALATPQEALTINGPDGSSGVTYAAGQSAQTLAANVNGVSGVTGVKASAETSATLVAGAQLTNGDLVTFEIGTYDDGTTAVGTAQPISVTITDKTDLTELAAAINEKSSSTLVTAELSGDLTTITLKNSSGYSIGVGDVTNGGTAASAAIFDVTADGATTSLGDTDLDVGDSLMVGGQISYSASTAFSVTSDLSEVLGATAATSSLNKVSDIDISTQAGSNDALNVVDEALAFIASTRADLGAVQNRFESTIANLQSVSENVSAARARIMDADFAAETANMTRAQVMQQAGVAMLAQANQLPQAALSLLQ
jgi:flagellin